MDSKVVGVEWQDTKIILTIEGSSHLYYLKNTKLPYCKVKLQYYSYNKYAINVINIGNKQPLSSGTWCLIDEKQDTVGIVGNIEVIKEFKYKEISKIKLYNNAQYNFAIRSNLNRMEIQVELALGKGTYSIRHIAKVLFFKVVSNLLNKKINNKNIIFLTSRPYIGEGNGKVLLDYIKNDLRWKEFNITQVNHDSLLIKGDIKNKLRIIYQLLRAKFIFVEDHYKVIENLEFNKEAEIIQLWHAAGAYKKVGYSRFGTLSGPSLYKNAHRKYTKAIVSAKRLIPYYAEAYGIDEKCIIATGLPRIDKFINPLHQHNVTESLYYEYPLFKGKKIILYAPTFREKFEQGKRNYYYDYSKIDFEALYNFCNEDYICIFKFHPFISEDIEIPIEYQNRLINMSQYQYSINNLLYITDILITDYSSVIFEFALLKKPILIYAYDIEQYEEDRGIYESLNVFAKNSICKIFDEVIKKLESVQLEETYKPILKNAFDIVDDKACERIAQEVFKKEKQ